MKAEFSYEGALIISAENHAERIALREWNKGFTPDFGEGCKSIIAINLDSYNSKGVALNPKD